MDKRRRRGILMIIVLIALAVVLALNPCDMFSGGGGGSDMTKGRGAMNATVTFSESAAVVPPIDASAPARIETATFALG